MSQYPVEDLDVVPEIDHKHFIPPPAGFREAYVAIKHHVGLYGEQDTVLGVVATIAAKERAWRPVRVDELTELLRHVPDGMKTNMPTAFAGLVRIRMIRMVRVDNVEWIVPAADFARLSYDGASTSSVVYYQNGAVLKRSWEAYPQMTPLSSPSPR